MSASHNFQPDWHTIAEKFDIWLPFIEPSGSAMIDAIAAKSGDKVLDIASGTGEPALTLARQNSNIEITGTDAAEGMVEVANAKAQKLGLNNMHFQQMPGDQLAFPDAHFDHVLCRFGLMFFEDPLRGLKEIRRVLKPGGRFAFAVWHTAESMPMMRWSHEAFSGKLPDEQLPPLHIITRLGDIDKFKALLIQAGFEQCFVEKHSLTYQFDSLEHYWDMLEFSEILKAQWDAINEEQRAQVKDEISIMMQEFISDSGIHVPHDYLLAFGT